MMPKLTDHAYKENLVEILTQAWLLSWRIFKETYAATVILDKDEK
jgi:hypothetical protein